MKITDYPQIPQLAEDNVFLVDGPSGTKIIQADNLITFLLNMLDPVDFIGYIDLTKLSKVVTLASENLILVADENGNKAMVADKAAENLLKLMNATEFSKKLSPASLEANQDIADDDVLVMGDAENGVRKITGENAAQSMLSLANQTNFTKKVKPSLLTANLDLASNDQLLMEDVNDGTRKISASVAAKSLLALMNKTEFADKLDVTEYAAVNVITDTDEFLIKTANGLKRVVYSNLKEILRKPSTINERRKIYRGKNFGNAVTQEMINSISSGTFDQFYIGDYFYGRDGLQSGYGNYNSVWYIGDFDFWHETGDTNQNTHHILIMPQEAVANSSSGQWYWNSGYEKGYLDSFIANCLKSDYVNPLITNCIPTFLRSRMLSVMEYVTSGSPTTYVWTTVDAIIPTMFNMFGIGTPDQSGIPIRIALCEFFNRPIKKNTRNNKVTFLRDIYDTTHTYVLTNNYNIMAAPSGTYGYVPVIFAIH